MTNQEKKMARLMLISASRELQSYIDEANRQIKKNHDCTSMDDPELHDHQTCAELRQIAEAIISENRENTH